MPCVSRATLAHQEGGRLRYFRRNVSGLRFAGYWGFYRLAAEVASATETKSYRGVNGDGHRSTELRFVPLFCVPMKGRSTSSATVNVLRDPANSRSAR